MNSCWLQTACSSWEFINVGTYVQIVVVVVVLRLFSRLDDLTSISSSPAHQGSHFLVIILPRALHDRP